MWLGDIDTIDEQTQAIIRAFNVESDHLLVDSEFYQAQMKCIFSNPIIERRILNNKKAFIANIEKKYGLDISHLTEECRIHEQHIGRPVVFTEQTVSEVINAYDKILIEGFKKVLVLIKCEICMKFSTQNQSEIDNTGIGNR